jgi:hypothetical protein
MGEAEVFVRLRNRCCFVPAAAFPGPSWRGYFLARNTPAGLHRAMMLSSPLQWTRRIEEGPSGSKASAITPVRSWVRCSPSCYSSCADFIHVDAFARARGARRDQTDPLDPPGRRCGLRPTSPIPFFANSGWGRPMERGGARLCSLCASRALQKFTLRPVVPDALADRYKHRAAERR